MPVSAEHFDLLIVLGGPQTPATTKGECPYFDAEAEEALIAKAISSGRAVVGMCLGAQLIGEALGAKYESSPQKEMGKFAITLTERRSGERGRVVHATEKVSGAPAVCQRDFRPGALVRVLPIPSRAPQ